MNNWKYLESNVFQNRQVIAARYFENARPTLDLIIEIGSWKNPISEFLYFPIKCCLIDPLMSAISGKSVVSFCEPFRGELVKGFTSGKYGVCLLGMDLEGMADEQWNELAELINGSVITVVEIPLDHEPSVVQFVRLQGMVKKKIKEQLKLYFGGNNFDLTNSAPVMARRQMYILEGDK